MPSSSRLNEPEDGELPEDNLPSSSTAPPPKLIRPAKPAKQWVNALSKLNVDSSSSSKLPPPPPQQSATTSTFTSASGSSVRSRSPGKSLNPHGLPPRPSERSPRHKESDREERRKEKDKDRVYDDYEIPPSTSRSRYSPSPQHRRDREDRYRNEYDRGREDRYWLDDRDRDRDRYRSDDRYSRGRGHGRHDREEAEYTSAWGQYNKHRDSILKERSVRSEDHYDGTGTRSPARRRGDSPPQSEYRRSDKEEQHKRSHDTPLVNPYSKQDIHRNGVFSKSRDLPEVFPEVGKHTTLLAENDLENKDRSAPIRILNRPTHTQRSTDEESTPSVPTPPTNNSLPPPSPPPPVDENGVAPPVASPPPPPPDSPPPPPEPPTVDVPLQAETTASPSKSRPLVAKAEQTANPYAPKPIPHAPNRNLLDPPTRAATPTAKKELNTNDSHADSQRFRSLTAEEELKKLGKTFEGTTTLAAYDLGAKLGEGTFGVVTKGVEIATKRVIALKKLITHNPRDGVSVTTVREIKILKSLNHPSVVPILNMVVERKIPGDRSNRGEVFMVFPYMDHDLCGLLANQDFKMTHSMAKLLMRQILEGIDYIHLNNFIHRDIKTANILVDKHGQIKIADFGLARSWTHDALMPPHLANEYTNMVVTRWYRAPELLLGDTHYGPAVDIWSLGCVLGEMYFRHPILAGDSDRDQLYQIFSRCGPLSQDSFPGWDRLPGFPEAVGHPWERTPVDTTLFDSAPKWGMDQGGADLMMKLLKLDPKQRLTAYDALDHPWFWTAPLPADPNKTTINVESSHEMTTRQKQEPVASQAIAPARPPRQHQQIPFQSRPPPSYGGPPPGPRPQQGYQPGQQGFNNFGPPGQNQQGGYPPPGPLPMVHGQTGAGYQQQNGNPYGPPMGVGMGMGMPMQPQMGFNGPPPGQGPFGRSQTNGPYGQQRPPSQQGMGIPTAPFKLSGSGGGGGGGPPSAPFKLTGNNFRPPGRSMTQGNFPANGNGVGNGNGMKRAPSSGGAEGWRDEKRRKHEGGLPY
ncbi:CMGC/CDK/CDK9 protein kinase [Kwoniella mangroviensis CBS 10435]|uniref:CMGC/CDK/CDK9 protein kinase n=1 Tax=Kwoniella mangroviensis CBS 10435 TaxID=1331196 RepID=A0A1B9IRE3_9TREE|nr:CMGC/CDK/CDK9 protein kinase [Kwoniella mangroviensis CBS 10435]